MKIFPKIELDKRLHFAAGVFFSTFFIATIFLTFTQSLLPLFLLGVGISAVAGAGKELIWDKLLGWGNPDIYDFLFTLVGGIIGSGIIVFFLAL